MQSSGWFVHRLAVNVITIVAATYKMVTIKLSGVPQLPIFFFFLGGGGGLFDPSTPLAVGVVYILLSTSALGYPNLPLIVFSRKLPLGSDRRWVDI